MITVLCPTYNEIEYIEDLVNFLTQVEPQEKEIIFIDGISEDGTKEFLEDVKEKYSEIRLLENPDQFVPFALNKGIKKANGDIIIRIDAHTKYDKEYFNKILATFDQVEADIVGGAYRIAHKNEFQKIVGRAISNPFGVGDSKVHDKSYRGYVDSVAYGAWKKEIFTEIGLFDEKLKRNQDDEFHYRAKSKGKKIFIDPDIKLWYYPRSTFKDLFSQYYQYGLFKPLVLRKISSEAKIRHLVPSFFVAYLILLPLLIYNSIYFAIPIFLYILIDLVIVLKETELSFIEKLKLFFVFPILHIAYGSGFIIGLKKII